MEKPRHQQRQLGRRTISYVCATHLLRLYLIATYHFVGRDWIQDTALLNHSSFVSPAPKYCCLRVRGSVGDETMREVPPCAEQNDKAESWRNSGQRGTEGGGGRGRKHHKIRTRLNDCISHCHCYGTSGAGWRFSFIQIVPPILIKAHEIRSIETLSSYNGYPVLKLDNSQIIYWHLYRSNTVPTAESNQLHSTY